MGSKGMSLGMIRMYEQMVNEEFEPIINMAEARNARLAPAIRRAVYAEMGIYELEAKRAAIEQQMKEVDDQITLIKGKASVSLGYGRPVHYEGGLAQKEIDRRLADVDGMVSGLHEMKDSILKKIKLSGSTPEVQKTFERLEFELKEMLDKLAALPPVETVLKEIGADPSSGDDE